MEGSGVFCLMNVECIQGLVRYNPFDLCLDGECHGLLDEVLETLVQLIYERAGGRIFRCNIASLAGVHELQFLGSVSFPS